MEGGGMGSVVVLPTNLTGRRYTTTNQIMKMMRKVVKRKERERKMMRESSDKLVV